MFNILIWTSTAKIENSEQLLLPCKNVLWKSCWRTKGKTSPLIQMFMALPEAQPILSHDGVLC